MRKFPGGGMSPLTSVLGRGLAILICTSIMAAASAFAQVNPAPADPLSPLPQDTGTAGLRQMLRKLGTTARMLQVTAHPDDEDGGMLALEARGKGVNTTLLTLTRGEGGQNKVGSNLFDVLGVLRTLELTASDRYYGVEQRFSRVADFGFSKNPEETFQKWQGHEVALGDVVRVIRTFHPDVLIARFSGTSRDGHGNHEASGLVTQEAFAAAADPARFPEQIQEGLLPWQAKKLYIGNVCGFGSSSCPDESYTVKLNTGHTDPLLGMSYIQFAMEGLRHQLSQGAGAWSIEPGDRFTFYRLVNSAPSFSATKGHEQDFFDGIDTSLAGLASALGSESGKVTFLRPALIEIAGKIDEASKTAEKEAKHAAGPLFAVLQGLDSVIVRVEASNLADPSKRDLLSRLREKQQEAQAALNLALGVSLTASVEAAGGIASLPNEHDALTAVSHGQKVTVIARFHNGSKYPLVIDRLSFAPDDWSASVVRLPTDIVQPGGDYQTSVNVQVPAQAPYTRPFWHRNNPETDSVNTIDDAKYVTLPFPATTPKVLARYRIAKNAVGKAGGDKPDGANGNISAKVLTPFIGEDKSKSAHELAVVPTFSVSLEPGEQVIPVGGATRSSVKVAVTSNLAAPLAGKLHLVVPEGWHVEPEEFEARFKGRGEKQEFEFKVLPASLNEGHAEIRAIFDEGTGRYSEGYTLVSRSDLNSFYYYQPAIQRISIVDVKLQPNLKVGYVMGAGDAIFDVLKQVGVNVVLIPGERLGTEDLSQYGTIVLGIRAYDTQKEVAANNKKLLEYVSNGGTLVVQYNASVGDLNGGHYTPYPVQFGRTRVSVEGAPIFILEPGDSIFHFPNEIGSGDYSGWVQERGLNFADSWDEHFKPLLASHDPGEPLQKGGMLRARYGKGTYIYTGYAFFRQLPAGIPGAVRLFVNLLSAGHE